MALRSLVPVRPRRPGARLLALAVVGAALAAAPRPARAGVFTFLGTYSADWSYLLYYGGLPVSNWQFNAYPMRDSYADEYRLGLATSTGRLASNMDFSPLPLGRLSFD